MGREARRRLPLCARGPRFRLRPARLTDEDPTVGHHRLGRRAINTLHARLSDLKTRQLFLGDEVAYLEGTGASEDGTTRIPFCVAYDLVGDRIAAMRAYGQIASLMPPAQWASVGVIDDAAALLAAPARVVRGPPGEPWLDVVYRQHERA